MKLVLKDGIDIREIDFDRTDESLKMKFDGEESEFQIEPLNNGRFLLKLADQGLKGYAVRVKNQIFVRALGRHWVFEDVTEQAEQGDISGSGIKIDNVISPMPGTVIKVMVKEGEIVKTGQPLAIVEAMKMENQVVAPMDAVVKEVLVEAGQQVGAGEVLIEFKEPESDEESSSA